MATCNHAGGATINAYFFDWKAFVTDALLARLSRLAGLDEPISALRPEIEPLAAQLLAALGRRNVAPRIYSEAERTAIAVHMVQAALSHALAPARRRALPGYTVKAGAAAQPPTVVQFDRISLNQASAAQLDHVPGVGRSLATRIVKQRRIRPFRSLKDLDERVADVGPGLLEQIGSAVTLAMPSAVVPVVTKGDFDQDWPTLVNQQVAPDALTRVLQALEMLLLQARAEPNPAPVDLPDNIADSTIPALHPLEEIEVLFGTHYHTRLIQLLTAAVSRVEISMFHIALPTANHPTSKLLSAVKAAHERGVAIRVLVDSDRREDPYLSTVINKPAVEYLRAAGVSVREDAPDKLLHSKCLTIDDELLLIGSHNWTAGSYFQFDDLTLAIRSAPMVAQQRQRFDRLWATAAGTHRSIAIV